MGPPLALAYISHVCRVWHCELSLPAITGHSWGLTKPPPPGQTRPPLPSDRPAVCVCVCQRNHMLFGRVWSSFRSRNRAARAARHAAPATVSPALTRSPSVLTALTRPAPIRPRVLSVRVVASSGELAQRTGLFTAPRDAYHADKC